ncbi:MAG: hypothetical protein M1835_003667 [Candelina submexicana]|nr:MAG: hypothetical protein M1835_003667 [Candelina submexicana]
MHIVQGPRAVSLPQLSPPGPLILGNTTSVAEAPDGWLPGQRVPISKHKALLSASPATHPKKIDLLDLPLELVRMVVEQMVTVVGLAKAVRLRLISRCFDSEVLRAIFVNGAFDFPRNWQTLSMSRFYLYKAIVCEGQCEQSVETERHIWRIRSGDHGLGKTTRLTRPRTQRLYYTQTLYKVAHISEEGGFWNAFAAIVSTGDIPKLTKLLEMGIPSSTHEMGLCGLPTTVAAGYGQCATLQFLLDRGFGQHEDEQYDVQHSPKTQYNILPALRRASEAGHEDIVGLLLTPNYGMPRCGKGYEDAILAASKHGHMAILRTLINHATDLSTTHVLHRMMFTAAYSGRAEVVQMLLDAGIPADIIDNRAEVPLKQAAIHGRTSVVRLLLPRIPRSISSGENAVEALVLAAKNGHIETAQVLLDAGTDINAKGWRSSINKLGAASENKNANMVRFLLEKGAGISATLYGDFAIRCSTEGV